jgi:hypothetical protein
MVVLGLWSRRSWVRVPSLTLRKSLENGDFGDSARAPTGPEGAIEGAIPCSIQSLTRHPCRSRANDAPYRRVAADAGTAV